METLYELLGALPRDDAEDLRKAFRRAVKGSHPDLRPGDPEAALKFRQIVRANEILNDPEQRAAYDHLLMLARLEKNRALVHPIAAKIHKVASGMMALASASIVTVGGYLVFMHMSIALVAPPGNAARAHNSENNADLTSRVSASIAAVSVAAAPDPTAMSALLAKGSAPPAEPPAVITAASPPAAAEKDSLPQPVTITLPEVAPAYATLFRASRLSADYSGGLEDAAGGLDQAIDLNPKLLVTYADRGIPFYRTVKTEHVFANVTPVRHAEKPSHGKASATAAASKPDVSRLAAVPLPRPRVPLRVFTRQNTSFASVFN